MQDTTRQIGPRSSLAGMAKPTLIAELVELAKHGLPRMFIPERQLFCRTLNRDADGKLLAEGASHRCTAIALLLGLLCALA